MKELPTTGSDAPRAGLRANLGRVSSSTAADAARTRGGGSGNLKFAVTLGQDREKLAGSGRILEMVATGAPLNEVLDALMRFVESQEPGMICGLLITDDGVHLRPGSGPNMPVAYKQAWNEAIKTIPVTPPYFSSCAEAIHCSTSIVVPNVAKEERYSAAWRELMLASGLHACRSTPVYAANGRVVGCLALYFSEPRDPNPADPELIRMATHLATIALGHDRAEIALRESTASLERDLSAARQLQAISTLLIREGRIEALYQRIIEAARKVMWSDMASIQVLDSDANELRLIAWEGFHPDSAAFWDRIRVDSPTSCGLALDSRKRVIVRDVETRDSLAGTADLEHYRKSSIRAMQSTPLLSRSGDLLGMISTHWHVPHDPSESDLQLFDALARQAADLIERAQYEEELRVSRENLTMALAASDTGTFRWDPRTGEYLEFDDNLKRLFGFASDEPVRDFIARVHPDDVPALIPARDACRSGTDFSMEYRVVLPTGEIRWLYDRAKIERDGQGNPICLFGACTDITKRKEAEAALRDFNAALEVRINERTAALETAMDERRRAEVALQQAQRLEALGRLTGGVAHDFNNLLTVVVAQAEAIIAAAGDNHDIARMATAAQRAAERGARLTSQLLAFGRHQQLRSVAVAVYPLVANISDLVRRAIGEAVTVELSADLELWPSRLDVAQFESAVLNLAINARDAMPAGGRLTIKAQNASVAEAEAQRLDLAPGDYVVIGVTDTGTGMTPTVLQRAFEPFFTTKDVGKGSGLGLAQIYGFARQSGGTAAIVSAVGAGTTVTLYFPKADTGIVEAESPAVENSTVQGRGKTVLLVEDRLDVRGAVEAALDGMGFRVLTAPDGAVARTTLESTEAIDLLLTDVVMPNGVSGLDLAQEARRLRQDIKVVLMSGFLRSTDSRMAAAADFHFLEKPFRQAQLAETIAAALSGDSGGGGGENRPSQYLIAIPAATESPRTAAFTTFPPECRNDNDREVGARLLTPWQPLDGAERYVISLRSRGDVVRPIVGH